MTDTLIGLFYYCVGALLFLGVAGLAAKRFRPHRPNVQKNAPYESGEAMQGPAWQRTNVHFFVLAIIFILFEVEVVFLFPLAVVYKDAAYQSQYGAQWTLMLLCEAVVFIVIMAMGLAYVWRNGYLDAFRPEGRNHDFKSPVPKRLYEDINEKYK